MQTHTHGAGRGEEEHFLEPICGYKLAGWQISTIQSGKQSPEGKGWEKGHTLAGGLNTDNRCTDNTYGCRQAIGNKMQDWVECNGKIDNLANDWNNRVGK